MKRTLVFRSLILGFIGILCSWVAEIPQTQISNGLVTAKLYLPDGEKGYYRGTRFDWAGVIPELKYKGHNYFGQWNPSNDPKLHDAIMGPVEEYMVMDYENTPVGSEFLKIGVGTLIKPDQSAYSFAKKYEIKNPGKWTVTKGKDQVRFEHQIFDAAGYAYQYTKVVRLEKGKPELVLEHRLKNTGKKAIETSAYNHNFFVIDGEGTNQNIKTSFPYDITAEGKGFGDIALAKNKSITYTRALNKGENVFSAGVQGFSNNPEDYNFYIQNLKSGANVRITSDQPLEKIVYWSCNTTSCPEPYIKISVKSGEEKKWEIRYTFSSDAR